MALLSHVLWIGGAPGSGKTTVATRMARRHGLRWYGADTKTWAHRDRALAEGNPAALRWEAMTPAQRWEGRTSAELLELSLHTERGPMVIDDLRRLPTSPLIVAEGSPLSPVSVSSGAAERSRAVWLLPTPEFQRAQLEEREVPRGPRELYLLIAAQIEREARKHAVPILPVDGSETSTRPSPPSRACSRKRWPRDLAPRRSRNGARCSARRTGRSSRRSGSTTPARGRMATPT